MWGRLRNSLRHAFARPQGARAKARALSYSAPYENWDAAVRAAGGYASPTLFDQVKATALAVKQGRADHARDGIVSARPAHRWPLLSSLLYVAGRRGAFAGGPLHVVDFGGALGAAYFQHRRILDRIPDLAWSIVEQPHYVQWARDEIADARLQFFTTIAEARARGPIDAILFVSSLQYLEQPFLPLEETARLEIPHLVLDAMHWTEAADDVIRVQRVDPPFHAATLPMRFLSRPKLMAFLASLGYEPVTSLPAGGLFQKRLA